MHQQNNSRGLVKKPLPELQDQSIALLTKPSRQADAEKDEFPSMPINSLTGHSHLEGVRYQLGNKLMPPFGLEPAFAFRLWPFSVRRASFISSLAEIDGC
jgi:hypothetical protein